MARKTPTYRPVSITIWDDIRFSSLSDDGKLLWLFFLTSSSCPIPGVLIASAVQVGEQIGWTADRVRSTFAELVHKGINVAWEGRVVWCANSFKHQPVAGPNPMKSMATAFANLPPVSFRHALWLSIKEATRGWSQAFRDLFPEPPRVIATAVSPVDQVVMPWSTPSPTPSRTPSVTPSSTPSPTPSLQDPSLQDQEQDLEQESLISSSWPSAIGGGDQAQGPPPWPPGTPTLRDEYAERVDPGAIEVLHQYLGRAPAKGGAN